MKINKIILNLLNDKASKEELEVLENWKSESDENIRELNDIIKLHKTTGELSRFKEYDVQAALAKVESRILPNDQLHPELQTSLNFKRVFIVLISLIAISSLILLSYVYTSKPEEPKSFHTDFAKNQIDLNDGSLVNLDQSSSLVLDDDFINNRVVKLNGRAYFTVKHISEEVPFTIKIPNAEIIVIGTEFSVYSEIGYAEIAVVSGVVEVLSENRKVRLNKGDRLLFQDNDFLKLANSNENYFGWNSGVLNYDDSTLREVFEDLMWTYNVKIDTDNIKFPTGCRVSTKYHNMELKNILEELNSLFGLDYIYTNDIIFVKNINCR